MQCKASKGKTPALRPSTDPADLDPFKSNAILISPLSEQKGAAINMTSAEHVFITVMTWECLYRPASGRHLHPSSSSKISIHAAGCGSETL